MIYGSPLADERVSTNELVTLVPDEELPVAPELFLLDLKKDFDYEVYRSPGLARIMCANRSIA